MTPGKEMRMKRTIKKQIWMTRDEAQSLKKKAKAACMTEARLMRMLLEGYEPPAAPDDRFYEAMEEIGKLGDDIEAISFRCIDPDMAWMLEGEVKKWHKLQADIEHRYLRPEKAGIKWQ